MKSIKYISMGIVLGGLFVGCCCPQATTESVKVKEIKCDRNVTSIQQKVNIKVEIQSSSKSGCEVSDGVIEPYIDNY